MANQAEKLTDAEVLKTCRLYYLGGFFFLPGLWLLNVVYFYPIRDRPTLSPLVPKYIQRSLVLSILGFALTTAWFVTYLVARTGWGETGDLLSVNIPKGY